MLGKLLKHELKSYSFPMGIAFLTGFVFTIFMKIICMLPYQGEFKEIVHVLSFYAYFYIVPMIAVVAQILIVVRFYTTMVGDRGYLTWTLPVKSSTILWSKTIAGGVWYILCGVVAFLLFILFFIGNYWTEGFDVFSEMKVVYQEIMEGPGLQIIVPVILILLASIIWSFASFALTYMCIAVGQLFGKWRILASIGMYFLIMFVTQILATILTFIFIGGTAIAVDKIVNIDIFLYVNVVLAGLVILGAGCFAGVFAINNWIFKKHLNLE